MNFEAAPAVPSQKNPQNPYMWEEQKAKHPPSLLWRTPASERCLVVDGVRLMITCCRIWILGQDTHPETVFGTTSETVFLFICQLKARGIIMNRADHGSSVSVVSQTVRMTTIAALASSLKLALPKEDKGSVTNPSNNSESLHLLDNRIACHQPSLHYL
ncbi:unnamed protein product [Lathyrus sativus]|nr:unnamed protein product [Lathyrus sativus]